jgi:hypothetical protein
MRDDDKKSSKPKELVITKETIKNLTVRTGIKTGMRPAPGGGCPSWPDASCCPPTSVPC